jgi:hypothetical protein
VGGDWFDCLMPGETRSYQRLKDDMKANRGLAFRLFNKADGGYPDWVLVHRCFPIAFAEVKSVIRVTHKIELSTRQQLKFSAVLACDAPCFLLAWCIEAQQWAWLDGRDYKGPLAWQSIPDKNDVLQPHLMLIKKARGNVVSIGDYRPPKPAS